MRSKLKKLLFSLLVLVGSISLAQAPKCSDLFGPNLETLLEKAGQLEFDLNQSITMKHNALESQSEVKRLEQVQFLIEDLFSYEGPEDGLIVLSKRLDELTVRPELKQTFVKTEAVRPTVVVEAKTARKDYETIQFYLKEKYNKFLDEVSKVRTLSELAPSWSLERVDVLEITREPTFSVRLNQGYRVLFIYEPVTGVKVLRISMKVTH